MFYDLPKEIIDYIYSFDPTYHEVYRTVVKQIIPYRVYKRENYILIVKKDGTVAHSTNSIENPSYICSHYLQTYHNTAPIMDLTNLEATTEMNHVIQAFVDEYDLEAFPFRL